MKINSLGVLLILLTSIFTACAAEPVQRPEDFSLTFGWNTGALPPQYFYSYTISVEPDGTGKLTYQPGYQLDNTENFWQTEFNLTNKQMDDLYQYLLDNDLLRSSWKEGEILLGSSGTSISITANGKEFLVPSISKLQQADRLLVNAAMDYIHSLVPQDIWDEMDARQQKYEAEFQE